MTPSWLLRHPGLPGTATHWYADRLARHAAEVLVVLLLVYAGLQCPMKQLDLSFNRLGDSGARALANMMTAVPLLALELEGNQVCDSKQ